MATRKVLWSNVKEIKSKTPAARVTIPYPAKLLVNGVVMDDMFPDGGSVVGGYRIDTEKYFGVKKPVQILHKVVLPCTVLDWQRTQWAAT